MVQPDSNQPKEIQQEEIDRLQRARNLWYWSPIEVISGIVDFLPEWWKSRNWKAISVIIPPLLLLATLGGLVLVGSFRSKESLIQWYYNQARVAVQQIVAKRKEGGESKPEEIERAELLFKRILQLGKEGLEARFFVAQQNIDLGRIDYARRMIEKIAPSDRAGLPIAHGWLANDLLARAAKGEPVPSELMRHHLGNSLDHFNLSFDAQLYIVYASMLDRENRISDAGRILTRAGEVDPSLRLRVIEYFLQRNQPNQARGAADSLIEKLSDSIKQKSSDDKDRSRDVVMLARAYSYTDRINESIAFLERHPPNEHNSADWKRIMSDNYRTLFRKSLVAQDNQVNVNISFLNAAIALDPTNIAFQSELAILRELGMVSTPERRQSVFNLIASQGSSIVPKLLLAEDAIVRNELKEAASYYEIVLAEIPDCTLVLNNMAVVLSKRGDSADLERAMSLISKAIELSPSIAEFQDTKGDIALASKQTDLAEKSYLQALNLAPARLQTRDKLIRLYSESGNEDEATKQREIYKRVEQELVRAQRELEKARELQKKALEQAIPTEQNPNQEPSSPDATLEQSTQERPTKEELTHDEPGKIPSNNNSSE